MKLYNTLTRTTEPFSPNGDTVSMYVCGLTPYAPSHIGHVLRAVVFDVLRRYLEYTGHAVKHVENFTDIDDKMIRGAAQQGISTQELAEKHIRAYLAELNALNVLPAHVYPKATEEIPQIVKMIEVLVDKGFAYAVDGDVYFRVKQGKDYGKLSHRSVESMRAGAKAEADESKEDVMDFALWKSQKPGEPSWDSPWGPGRPGWHIECSAMSMSYLGETLDIHGGGVDLVFPHHENEIAQTENYSDGTPMARFWVHNGMLRLSEEKMSKSLGNLVTVSDALERFSADALRLFFLSSHYRSPLSYSDEAVAAQERAVERLRHAVGLDGATGDGPVLDAEPQKARFVEAMDEDLNTARASAVLFDLAHEINRASGDGRDVTSAQATLRELAGVLGLTLRESEPVDGTDVAPLIEMLIEARAELRAAKKYEAADAIRDKLADLGFSLEDTAAGTEWRRRAR